MNHFNFILFQAVSYAGVLVIIYIFNGLSRHLGEALHIKNYYHLFTIGVVFIICSMIIHFFLLFTTTPNPEEMTLYGRLANPLAIFMSLGVTFCLAGILKYWGWLIKEIF